jgi:hypothetical protein
MSVVRRDRILLSFSSEGGTARFSWALVRFSGDALQSNWSQSRRLLYTDQNREAKMEIPVEETRQYIRDFDRLAGMTETARELYDKMLELYPERVNPLPLWLSARTAKP